MAVMPLLHSKTCTKCCECKPVDAFPKDKTRSDGLFPWCRICKGVVARASYRKNPEKQREAAAKNRRDRPETMRKWRAENPDRVRANNVKYYADNRDRELARYRRYADENADLLKEYRRRTVEQERARKAVRRKRPHMKINEAISRGIHRGLRQRKGGRHWEDLVGYSLAELMSHLERQFLPGMTWDNHSQFGWHIDHIIPLSAFNFEDADHIDFRRAWALSNLQPLWWQDNLKKSAKIEVAFQPSLAI